MASRNKASQQVHNEEAVYNESSFIKDHYFRVNSKQYLIDTCKFKVASIHQTGQPKNKQAIKSQSLNQKEGKIEQQQRSQKQSPIQNKNQQVPSCRYNVKSTVHDGYLYTFGGNKFQDQQDQVLYAMNLHTQKWQRISKYIGAVQQSNQQAQSNTLQKDDYGITTHDNQIYIYGGYEQLHELIKYNPLKEQWTTIQTGNAQPSTVNLNIQNNQNSKTLVNQGPNALTKKISNSENPNPYPFKSQARKPRDSQQLTKKSTIKPPVRGPGLFFSVNSEFIFLYGGLNTKSQTVYDDAYLLKTHSGFYQWEQLKIKNPPSPRIGMSYAQCGTRYFMFGGQGISDDQMCFFNELYQILIDEVNLQVEFRFLNSKNSVKQQYQIKSQKQIDRRQNQIKKNSQPVQRAYHGMVGISKRFFVLFGGQTSKEKFHSDTLNQKESNILNDMWVYDIYEMRWSAIQPKNGLLKPIHSFAISSYDNKISIFGGLKSLSGSFSQQSYIIQFAQKQVEKYIVCQKCQMECKQQEQLQFNNPKSPNVSISFYYNLSHEIRFAFQAISLLIDASKIFQPQNIRISIQKTNNDLQFFSVAFSGQAISQEEFSQFTSNVVKTQKVKLFSNSIKYGGFRIGKTILFLSSNKKHRRIALMSADNKLVPNVQQAFQLYHYVQDIQTGAFDKYNGRASKQIIRGLLITHLNPNTVQQILCIQNNSKILVFSTNIITTLEKAFYFELVSYNKPQDILLYRSGKQVEFLKQIGNPIHISPQMSLVSFLKYYELEPTTKLLVNQMEQPIQTCSYAKTLKNLRKDNKIAKISVYSPKSFRSFAYDCELFEVTSQQFIEELQGVLIYYNNRLINRFDCNFGNLFYQKFYKKRYHSKSQNIWTVVGYINITVTHSSSSRNKRQPVNSCKLETNVFCTDFNNNNPEYQKLKRDIFSLIEQKQQQRQLRKVKQLKQSIQQRDKISKKVKTNPLL